MSDLTGQQVLFRIASLLLILATHGYAIALLARLMGDPGPGYDGRRTFNPLQHLEPVGALTMILFRVGWLKPTAIDPALIRGGRWGLLVIVFGSLAVTLAIGEVLWMLRPWLQTTFSGTSAVQTLVLMSENAALLSAVFAVVNLIPVPPFTAGILLAGFAPRLHARLTSRVVLPALAIGVALFLADRADILNPATRAIGDFFFR